MKAIIINQYGDPETLKIVEQPRPELQESEVLIHNQAAGLNPIDYKTRSGEGIAFELDDHFPKILGWDFAGTVCEDNTSTKAFKKGDAVFGMLNFPNLGNCYAEYVAASVDQIAHMPNSLSFLEAGASPLATLTAYQAISEMKTKPGQKILIHAGAGGVGHLAIQIAKQKQLIVYTTCSSKNRAFVESLGADFCIDYTSQALESVIAENELDCILDSLCGETGAQSLDLLKPEGTSILLALDVSDTVFKHAKETNKTVLPFRVKPSSDDLNAIKQLFESEALKIHVSQVYSPNDIQKAHAELAQHHVKGKLVLDVSKF